MPFHTQPAENRRSNRMRVSWRIVAVGAMTLVLVATSLFARPILGWWGRRAAAQSLHQGAIGAAEQWLNWADGFQPNHSGSELLRATCFRWWGDRESWEAHLTSARRRGAPLDRIQTESLLGNVRLGTGKRITDKDIRRLIEKGVSPQEATITVVYGLLAQKNFRAADRVINAEASQIDGAERMFLRGLHAWAAGQTEAAKKQFALALDEQANLELARAALAQLFEEIDHLASARSEYAVLLAAAPQRRTARIEMARVLRKLGELDNASDVLAPLESIDEMALNYAIERAEIETEKGNYVLACRWFKRADLERPHRAGTLRDAATAFALNGDWQTARQLFTRVDDVQGLSRQMNEWQRRAAIIPGDKVAAEELKRLASPPLTPPAPTVAFVSEAAAHLYTTHCSACHGPSGEGDGRAARHLFPRPRNLQHDSYRLVSTLNGVPTLDDIEQVIRRGMPGTSMPPFPSISQAERSELARQVKQFYHLGLRRRVSDELQMSGQAAEDNELDALVERLADSRELLELPAIAPADHASVQRGKELYMRSGCQHCHGTDGRGVTDLPLYTAEGQPSVPRDLVYDPFKGGQDPASIFKRIRLGMPGTPHPASPTLSTDETVALVQFCLSLSQEPKKELTNHQRSLQATRPFQVRQP